MAFLPDPNSLTGQKWIPDRYQFRNEQEARDSHLPFDDVYEHVGGSLQQASSHYDLPGSFIQLKSIKTGQRVGWVYLPALEMLPPPEGTL